MAAFALFGEGLSVGTVQVHRHEAVRVELFEVHPADQALPARQDHIDVHLVPLERVVLEQALDEVVRMMKHPSGELVYRKTQAKADLNCRQREQLVAPRESHWRAEAEWEGDVAEKTSSSFAAWVLAPTMRREWREGRPGPVPGR